MDKQREKQVNMAVEIGVDGAGGSCRRCAPVVGRQEEYRVIIRSIQYRACAAVTSVTSLE